MKLRILEKNKKIRTELDREGEKIICKICTREIKKGESCRALQLSGGTYEFNCLECEERRLAIGTIVNIVK